MDLTDAISRRLSPLEKTAAIAGFKSTRELGTNATDQDAALELYSREIDKRLQTGES